MADDFSHQMIQSVIEHWPLVAAIGISAYWITPRVLKAFFLNGGGTIVRGLIKAENEIQTVHHSEELDRRFREHENQEARRFERIEDKVFGRTRRSRS